MLIFYFISYFRINMPTVKYLNCEKEDFNATLLAKLKILGVKVPKHKRVKSTVSKVENYDHEIGHKIFGVTLTEQEWILHGETHLPKFLALSTAYLQKFSNKEIGLFRKAGNVARQKKLRAKLEQGGTLEDSEPNDVASLLKQWLRELPEPLVSLCLQEIFIRCLQLDIEENKVTACLLTCLLLQPDHLHTLKHLLCFLADIAHKSDENKMDTYNLALIMAPNIFVSSECSDKIKNNFQQQTCVMKILIKNCDKVGEIPDSINLPQQCPSSELDSSSDVLDSVPLKSRKKHKNDILSGIRKLVGQNGTPNSKSDTLEHLLRTPLDSKSTSKRKADPELSSLSTSKNKKPALSLENLSNPLLSTTPKRKANDTDKNICGHVRRKSIGALLRRKRGKSSKLSQVKTQVKDQSDMSSLLDVKDKKKGTQNSNICGENFVFLHEQVAVKPIPITIKKSSSDSHLPLVDIEFSVQPTLVISSSQGSLPKRLTRTSSRSLRSEKFSGSQIGEAILLDSDQGENNGKKTQERSHKKEFSEEPISSKGDCKNINGNVLFSDTNNKDGETLPALSKNNSNSNKLKSEKNQDIIIEFMNSKKQNPLLTLPNSRVTIYNDASSLTEFTPKTEINTGIINDKITKTVIDSQCYALKRQEAFIVKSIKASPSITGSQIKSFDYDTPENLCKNQTEKNKIANINFNSATVQHGKIITPQRKSLKRKTRHGSLIRGRPNSVNNGLQVAFPHHCHNDWSVLSSSSPNLSNREDTFTYDDSKFLESPVLQNLDLSLNALLQSISLFSPSDSSNAAFIKETHSDGNSSTLKPITSLKEEFIEKSHSQVESEVSKLNPRLRSQKRLSINLDSDINHSMKHSKVNRVNSFTGSQLDCNPDVPIVKHAKTEPCIISDEIIEMKGNNTPDSLPQEENLNESCFRTPSNKTHSPDSVTWMSGGTFFSNLSPPSEEPFNKRESIAMILKNKTGHVQAKVDLYDNKLHKSNSCSAKKYNTKDEKLIRASSQKCYSAGKIMKVSKTKGYDSENRSNSVRSKGKFQMSPLPQPPKFTLTDLSTPSPKVSHPLKELTNVSSSIGDLKTSISPKKSSKSNTPIKYGDSPLLSKGIPIFRMKKLKRSSFSGQTPYTLRKKVSRSESSPACHRKVIILHE